MAAAAETVLLVVGEDSPLPETPEDIADLVLLLRGHVMKLGPLVPAGPALAKARALCDTDFDTRWLPSRRYLRKLALATRDLIGAAAGAPQCPCLPRVRAGGAVATQQGSLPWPGGLPR
ncbi:DUF6415 family natural product biosynthesis protein [Streptomyces sp. NPDC059819]|uniref:DUF6415 family natural product biosynthesis protein n=1 Tax=Streptomyces sp. NPDC059819 TaxID=3346963 RepID=UPI00364C4028